MFEWLFKYSADRYHEGAFGFTQHPRIELVLLGFAILCAAVWWQYRREAKLQPRPQKRLVLAALRIAGVSLLVLAILGPVLKTRTRDEHKGTIAVAVDISKSMSLANGPEKISRLDRARKALLGKDGFIDKLSKAGADDVRLYAFGNNLQSVDAAQLAELKASDDNTQLAGALKKITQSARGIPLEAVVVLTDGVDTTSQDPAALARYASDHGASVHTIGFGERADAPDVKILAVQAPRRAQLGAILELKALIHRGSVQAPLELRLFQDQTLLKTESVPPSKSGEAVSVSLTFIPDKEGTARLVLEIPAAPDETLLDNNKYTVQIDVEEKRVEVLFVEGSPRHEYAFISRAMWDNRYFKVVSLVRLGKGRFYHRGDDGNASNEGFPETAEALGRFKAIILSDIEASYFSAQQMQMISDFVKVRGGGLLMLGGVNSFNLGGYKGTPVADLLPVSLDAEKSSASFNDTEFAFQVTQEGAEHEILKLTPDPAENASQWALMPPLRGFNPLYVAKPGARVLGVQATTALPTALKNQAEWNGKPVLLALQDVGAGRTAAFAAANSWRWKMLRKSDDDAFRRFWSQMIRWLAVGSKEFLTITTDTVVAGLRQPVTISAQVLDRAHHPFNEAKVGVLVTDPFGNSSELAMPWTLNEDGVYSCVYHPAEQGEYKVAVNASFGETKLERGTSFVAIESSTEFAHPAMDAATLERIARAGHGTVDLEGRTDKALNAILASAQARRTVLETVEEYELRDAPILLLLIVSAWFAEWIIRKRSGLA